MTVLLMLVVVGSMTHEPFPVFSEAYGRIGGPPRRRNHYVFIV